MRIMMRSHTVKLNTARQVQCVKTVRLLRVFVCLFGKGSPFPRVQQLFATPTMYCQLYHFLSKIEVYPRCCRSRAALQNLYCLAKLGRQRAPLH